MRLAHLKPPRAAMVGPPPRESTEPWALTLILCIAASILEGVDIQAIGVAAPKLFPTLHVQPSQAGFIFSASTLGLCLGALTGGRLSDLFGRKRVLIVSVATFGVLSLATPLTHSAGALMIVRLLTGLGLGGAMPNLIALVSENSPRRWRVQLVTMMWAGTPLGGIAAAQIAAGAGDRWWAVFVAGGLAPVLLAPAMLALLPESSSFEARQAARRDGMVEHAMPTIQALFGDSRSLTTALVWSSYFCTQLMLYLLLNWLPLLMKAQGFSSAAAALSASAYNAGGVIGGVGFGLLLGFAPRRLMLAMIFAGMAAGLVALAASGTSLPLALGASGVCGLCVIGGQYVLYGLTPEIYPALGRGTGVGAAVAVGRLGSVAGPIAAGQLLSLHVPVAALMMILLPCVAIAAMAILVVETIKAAAAQGGRAPGETDGWRREPG